MSTAVPDRQRPVRGKIGMIVPPAHGWVPPEPAILFPDEAFVAVGLGLTEMTPDGYDRVIDRVAACAVELAGKGAEVVSLMGTSLSFYQGPAFNDTLIAAMREATGLPATTMTRSVLDAFDHLGATRIAVATAYGDSVNERLRTYLTASGLTIETIRALDIVSVDDVFKVTEQDIVGVADQAVEAAAEPEALFISCGGLQTASLTEPTEMRHGIPVVSSAMAGLWGVMRLAGRETHCPGYGRLFAA